jgi:hypothetical protein
VPQRARSCSAAAQGTLTRELAAYGRVDRVHLPLNKAGDKRWHKGVAFADLASARAAAAAVQGLHG